MKNISGVKIPVFAPEISVLPGEIQDLFRRAFVEGHSNPSVRPSPAQWHAALRKLRNELKKCGTVSYHQYYKFLSKCPWCEVDNAFSQKLAPKQPVIAQTTIIKPPKIKTQPYVAPSSPASTLPNIPRFSSKSRAVAGLLGLFLGPLGVHNFYLGRIKRGIAQFLLSFIFIGILWGYFEGLFILAGKGCKDGKRVNLKGRRHPLATFCIATVIHLCFCAVMYFLLSYSNILGGLI
jgi:TM2 domain-containing membrane protein YozV